MGLHFDKNKIDMICAELVTTENNSAYNTNQSFHYKNIPNELNNYSSIIDDPEVRLICHNYNLLNQKLKDGALITPVFNQTDDTFRFNLLKFTYPIILSFGLFGNFISFIVMLRVYNKRKSF